MPLPPRTEASPRVLVVEADNAIRSMVAEALELEGYVVEPARDGQEALGLVREGPPQAIVLVEAVDRLIAKTAA